MYASQFAIGLLQVRLAMKFRCPNCQHPIEVDANDTTLEASPQAQAADSITCPTCQSRFSLSSEDSPTHVPDKGMTIAHFEVRQVLGEGSFGTVYKCFDTELKRYVAVKVPREGRVAPDSAKLFMKEARAAAAVNHPNVISVHEVGQHGDGFYIAAEFIDGINLSETIRISPLSIKDATILAVKLLRAAHFFHEKGIVHRDLKSGNILIDAANEPHIADFGLARREGKNEITVTQSGHVIGTPAYMSPEQARGDVRGTGPASDQYSIGVIFYELLTGVRPFPATNSRTVMHRILTEPARNPRSVNKAIPKDLDTICIKALEKDPASRYSSAAEMANDLQRFLDGRPILARPASVAIKLQRWCRRNPGMAALSAVIAVLLVTTGLMAMQRPEPPEAVVRIEAPAAKTHPVRLTYSMNGSNAPANPQARWAIVPLDKLTGLPI